MALSRFIIGRISLKSIHSSTNSCVGPRQNRMSCHGRCAPEWMKRAKLWCGRHGGRRRLGVSEPVNEFDRRPFEHR